MYYLNIMSPRLGSRADVMIVSFHLSTLSTMPFYAVETPSMRCKGSKGRRGAIVDK